MQEVEVNQAESKFREECLAWARGPRERANWVRKMRPLKVSVKKYIFGQAISMIMGDDGSCFSQIHREGEVTQEAINLDRVSLLERLDWESSVHWIPHDLRTIINLFKAKVESGPWTNIQTEREVRRDWEQELRDFVRKELKNNPDYSEAQDYYQALWPKINPIYYDARKG